MNLKKIVGKKILITGGAGFIGSNLCEFFLNLGAIVICMDNLATGKMININSFIKNKNFSFLNADIRNIEDCQKACAGVDYILHQAALGSVPRSIKDPITSNEVNINGFLNMLVSARDNNVKRLVYAASSSTYGDSQKMPKIEDVIGKPLSPYAITKYVNELYAEIFSSIYDLETIGLRYFNVFGRKQDPNGAYAAVIPKFVNKLINEESPVINGDGSFSRDFTYIDNVLEANLLSLLTENKKALNTVYNIAFGERNTLNDLIKYPVSYLSELNPNINNIEIIYGPVRFGDIPHSHASIDKAKKLLNYNPQYSLNKGLEKAVKWYWKNLKNEK